MGANANRFIDNPTQQEWPLLPGQEPPLAAQLVSPRGLYFHHGLYVGHGRVIHNIGRAYGLRGGVVEEASLEGFARGRGIWVRDTTLAGFTVEEVIKRARARLGEQAYHFVRNNCEHFCEWCLRGQHRSNQIEAWRTRPGRALRGTRISVSRWLGRGPATAWKSAPFLVSGLNPDRIQTVS